jgi:nucleoredoxin
MRKCAATAVVVLVARFIIASTLPLTAKDVGLMLRSGCSLAQITNDLEKKRFAGNLDAAAEAALTAAGASPQLIGALRNGDFAVPAAQATQAAEQLKIAADRRSKAAAEAKKFDTLYQQHVAAERQTAAAIPAVVNTIFPALKGDLVRWHNGTIGRADDASVADKKLYALYFSAHWCAPCRKFTPQLVEFYNRIAPQHPEFELIFVSSDRSPFAMETYMRETSMPWPAIDFAKVAEKSELRKYAGSGIPDLVVVDSAGKVLLDSYRGKEYVGPGKVVEDLSAMFAKQTSVSSR